MSFWKCKFCKGELNTGKEKMLKICDNCAREEKKVFEDCWEKKSLRPAFERHGLIQKKSTTKILKSKKLRNIIEKKLKKQGLTDKEIENNLNKINN